ncbi:MAG: SET domain-containing protein-lysine N-methyltransferase [Alphaproteobacteria bacterium]|nr:SET domain-containing protein-lysine N-methyltransferase [Alphaproteobacteria bacterium]
MRICVLQPDYGVSAAAHGEYDPPRDLSALLPDDQVVHVLLRKATVYRQLRALRGEGFDVFVNLCEGYLDWDIPSIDVIDALDRLGLPHTGPTARLYDPSKALMKLCAHYAGVATPDFAIVSHPAQVPEAVATLAFPLFAKPAHAGDSLGVDMDSLCADLPMLVAKVGRLARDFDEILIERYLPGREFSVLVLAEPGGPGRGRALVPNEFVFPADTPFKTYDLKARQYLPDSNIPCREEPLASRLRDAARAIFEVFGGVGYCRMDFRVDAFDTPCFIDANFACSVLYPEGHSGTADYILAHEGLGQAGFLRHIIAEGLARHRAAAKPYAVVRSDASGYGIRATRAIAQGEIVFRGEERAQRVVTRRHVEETWSPERREVFRRYAYPLSDEVFVLWDEDPAGWAPQNHSCDPNTAFDGLNVVSLRPIASGDELTLDYHRFCDERMEPFDCACGAPSCRGRITGRPGNTLDRREAHSAAKATPCLPW